MCGFVPVRCFAQPVVQFSLREQTGLSTKFLDDAHRVDRCPLQRTFDGVTFGKRSYERTSKGITSTGAVNWWRWIGIERHAPTVLAIRYICPGWAIGNYHYVRAKFVQMVEQIVHIIMITTTDKHGFFAV